MAVFRPAIPPPVTDAIRHLPPEIKHSVRQAIRALAADPDLGDPLGGKLQGLWKYRVRRFRIVYEVDRTRRVLRIMAVGHRRNVYEEVASTRRRTAD